MTESGTGQDDAGAAMKARMRADLYSALREKRNVEVKILRELIAAIDNAEAPPIASLKRAAAPGERFAYGTAEVERLLLSITQVSLLLLAEIDERERATDEFERLGDMGRAEALRAGTLVAKRYLPETTYATP